MGLKTQSQQPDAVPEQQPPAEAPDLNDSDRSASQPQMEGQPGSAARKRHREEELGPDVPVEDTVRDMLVKGLSTLPAKALTDLRNALSEQHNVKLDNARQIAEMEERKRQGIAPKGFKIPTFHMPAGTEANEADGKATIMTAYVAVYDDIIVLG